MHSREQSLAWYNRAAEVIPGGVYGHTSPAVSLPAGFPYYIERAEGCYMWDVDGNKYLDFMCAYGPIVLGHQHPEVEAAANEERKKGGLYSHPSKVIIELAELLVDRIDFAAWSVFGKNGSDMTTWAMQVARQHTGKKKVLVVNGAYHGVDAWTNPSPGGIIEEDRAHIHGFNWNDLTEFNQLIDQYSGRIAAVVVNPYHHPAFAANEYPTEEFVKGINEACSKNGIVLILDDVRVGFRLDSKGSHRKFGWTPDLACYCKAMGNGYPVSATVGKEVFKQSAGKVFLTGSYWNDSIALAASKKCLEVIERDQIPEKLERLGEKLLIGLEDAARKNGLNVTGSRPACAPLITFENDGDLRLMQRFSELCAEKGVLFHHHHNWFISAAHTEEAIDEALAIAKEAFAVMKSESSV